jgi:ribosome maturation factor RimP
MVFAESLLPRLEELARRAAEPVGVEVAWVELKSDGQSCFFRVFIERDTGVGMEDCEQVSQRLGVLLDVEDPIEPSYTLEVSTPGLDRPLWTKRDYQRFSGRLACIMTREHIQERNRFRGRIAGVVDDDILLEDATDKWKIPFSFIESGKLEVEMFRPRPPAKPSKRHSPTKARRRL